MISKTKIVLLSAGLITFLIYIVAFHFLHKSWNRPVFIGKKTRHYKSGNHSKRNDTTLVTAFFATGTGKHTPDEYTVWMENFLGQVETPVVIFTQPEFQALMSKVRDGRPTEFRIYDDIWSVPWLHDPHLLYKDYFKMHDLDPEKDNHTPELYAVWNSKPWFLQTVSETNPFNSTYFYWMDVGSVREAGIVLTNFPSLERSRQVFGEDERLANFHKLNVFAVEKLPNFKPPPDHNTFGELAKVNFVEGGFFGGTASSINWFSRTFYALHNYQLRKGEFVGKDQTLYNWIATKYQDRFRVVCDCMQVPRDCGDRWFYFQKWYSDEDESNEQCRNATVENMTDFLLME